MGEALLHGKMLKIEMMHLKGCDFEFATYTLRKARGIGQARGVRQAKGVGQVGVSQARGVGQARRVRQAKSDKEHNNDCKHIFPVPAFSHLQQQLSSYFTFSYEQHSAATKVVRF